MSMTIPSHWMDRQSVHLPSIGENTHWHGLTTTPARYVQIAAIIFYESVTGGLYHHIVPFGQIAMFWSG